MLVHLLLVAHGSHLCMQTSVLGFSRMFGTALNAYLNVEVQARQSETDARASFARKAKDYEEDHLVPL